MYIQGEAEYRCQRDFLTIKHAIRMLTRHLYSFRKPRVEVNVLVGYNSITKSTTNV